jgi:hypothetical protein
VVEQTAFEIPLVGIVAEREKIEVVGILGDVLRQVGLWRRKGAVEVRNRLPLPLPPPCFDL